MNIFHQTAISLELRTKIGERERVRSATKSWFLDSAVSKHNFICADWAFSVFARGERYSLGHICLVLGSLFNVLKCNVNATVMVVLGKLVSQVRGLV